MWHPLMHLRKRVESRRPPARRRRWYRPYLETLEVRCLLSVSLSDGGATSGLVGSPVTWTATATGDGASPIYQFSVQSGSSAPRMAQDYSTSNSFTWNPMQEGNYTIKVNVEENFGGTIVDTGSASYTATTRITGGSAVVSPTSNPLVALFSAPPSTGNSMFVQFSPDVADPSWQDTASQSIVPGESTNFLVAGLLPNTTYLMQYVVDNETPSASLTFTTGSLPTSLTFPTITVPKPPGPGTDLTDNMILHVGLPTGEASLVATDLAGNIDWYYDPKANNMDGYATELVPGGTILFLGGTASGQGGESALKEMDLAGDTLRETNVSALNAQLSAQDQILYLSHEAQRLPNGYTAVLANNQEIINGTTYGGNEVLVLDQNFQVKWVWNAFDYLDTSRLPTDGEGPGDWLHANSISYSPEDGDLLVSLRAQDWVIKINYDNGVGDGHVVWRLGQGGDFTVNSSDAYPWFSHQHDAVYVNNNTIVLFDDGNTRVGQQGGNSRGQEWVLNEQTMTATLVVNADMGNYSSALGAAQVLSNGNLDFTSGDSGGAGQSIEASPDGATNYIQQVSGLEYRSYFMSTLYGGDNFNYGLLDTGFEQPSQGTGESAYQYDPTGSPWSFSGEAGMAGNGSAITSGDPNAPQGTQVAFLQGTGSTISQVAVNLAPGAYQLSVSAAQGGNNGTNNDEVIEVEVDGTVVATFTPSSIGYATYSTPSFNLTAGSHTIAFVGDGSAGTDYTALLDQVGLVEQASAAATYLKMDTTTQGSWQGVYGSQGYNIIDDAFNYPSYAVVSASGNSIYDFTNTTNDPSALQEVDSNNRIAAVWFSPSSFTINVDLTDGQTHQLALYLLDWDRYGGDRNEQIQILDATTGSVLSTESASHFSNGEYLVWSVSGDIEIEITNLNGNSNAVLDGLFFDPAGTTVTDYTPVSIASLTNADVRSSTFLGGSNYPVAPTSITVAGVPFDLVPFANEANSLGILETSGATTSFTLPTSVFGATTVYTLMNSQWGTSGADVGSIEFKGANPANDVVFQIVEGDNIRDHFNGSYNNVATNIVPNAFLNGVQDPNGSDRLDMQTFSLPAGFANDTLTQIIFTGFGGNPQGAPFLAAATVAKQATPTLSVTDAGGTYNGSAFPAVGTALGVDGKTPVNGSFSYAYYVGSSASGTPSTTAPSTAGTYTVVATFTSSDPNYASGGTAQTTFTIQPATPTLSVTDAGGTDNGNPFPATGTALGVDGKTAVNGSFSYAYYVGSSVSGTPSTTAPSTAGTYTVVATFTSSDPNYASGGTAQTTFTIQPATATPVTIDFDDLQGMSFWAGTPVPSWALLTNQYASLGVIFQRTVVCDGGVGHAVTGTNFIAGITPTGTVTYSSHYPQIEFSFFVGQTPATTDFVSIQGDLAGGNGQSQTLYAYDLAGNLVGSSTEMDTGGQTYSIQAAGIHTIKWSGVDIDDQPPVSQGGGVGLDHLVFDPVVASSQPTLSVSDAGGTYNGSAFPATAKAVGVDGKTVVNGSFSYAYYVGSSVSGTPSATAPTNAGTYTVVATFTSSDPNYASGGTAQTTFTIQPATPTLSVTDAGGTDNGNPFPAVGTALGVDGKTAVNGSFSYAYYVGSSASGTPSTTAPSTAGTYTVVATFTSSDPNYASGGTAQTTFTIQPATAATNLIVNGDFESGNTGFTTGYTYSPGNIVPEGTYDIVTNPHNSHSGGESYGDHTTGHGLMMALNGATSSPTIVWQETVSVQPNTNYQFSGWVSDWSALRDSALPELDFNFNGVLVGQFNVPPNEPIGQWDNVTFTWNSQNNSTLTITIIDTQTAAVGNDFALDDLSLTASNAAPQPTLSVSDAGGTYNGNAFPATAKAVGVDGKTAVNGSFSYAYYVGSSASGTPSATAPSTPGTYTVVATFTSSDPNYASGGTAKTTFTIKPATPTLSVTDASGTYNGHAFAATAKALGLDGKTAVNGSFSYAYYLGSSASGAALTTAPTNAGTYTVVATFTSSNPNYANGTARSTFTIAKAATASSNLTMPPQPSTMPLPILEQMVMDVMSLPFWSNTQTLAVLQTMLWIGYSTASAQSPQLAGDLIWAEMGLTWDLILAGDQPLLLVNDPHAIALANAIDENPLYHTLPGWLLANALADRLLIV